MTIEWCQDVCYRVEESMFAFRNEAVKAWGELPRNISNALTVSSWTYVHTHTHTHTATSSTFHPHTCTHVHTHVLTHGYNLTQHTYILHTFTPHTPTYATPVHTLRGTHTHTRHTPTYPRAYIHTYTHIYKYLPPRALHAEMH